MIQELQTGILDINNKYTVDFSCKQLDDIILKIIVYDKSLPADLSDYNVRLKAFKADQVPLIQNTNISIKDNFVTIKASKQLTTTQGIVKAELQFINKTTLEKKSTFYINIEVVASVLDVDGIVSTPTCTILEEIDHKLDEIENIGEVLDQAKEVRNTLQNTTIPTGININSKLETNTKNASTKITEVENIITDASNKIEEVETSVNNANTCKKELHNSSTIATTNKENLDVANALAKENIEELNKIGDAKDLATKVETNTTDITKLKTDVENNSSQMKDLTNNLSQLSNPSLFINGDFIINQRGQSIYTLTGISNYTVDRWISYNLADDITEVVKLDKGIKLLSKSGGSARLRQTFESDMTNRLKEKTVTFSMKVIKDCSMVALTVTKSKNVTDFSKGFNNVKAGTILTHTFMITNDYENLGIQFSTNDTNGLEVEWVKLELGSVATPFVPRPYAEELALCQRTYRATPYQQVFRMSYHTNDLVVFEYPIGTDMRTTPTIVGKPNVDLQLATLTGSTIEGCKFSITKTSNGLSIGANKTNHGCTDGILVIKNSCGFDSEMY
ncbi:hypothetical protein [Clostridium botulinum]|uniref:hypothetical protein n=1 Tax=Clostridium botulinum TaxID=1491 RepID=UPI0021BEFA24|nr:hypothetical protein [Clostridium botulinum]